MKRTWFLPQSAGRPKLFLWFFSRAESLFRFLVILGVATVLWATRPVEEASLEPAAYSFTPRRHSNLEVRTGGEARFQIGMGEELEVWLDLPSGKFLRLELDSIGVDLSLALFAPDGSAIETLKSPERRWGPESIRFLTAQSGRYVMRVNALEILAPRSFLEVEVAQIRDSLPSDRWLIEAGALHNKALDLSENDLEESNLEALGMLREADELWQKTDDLLGRAMSRHWVALLEKDLNNFSTAESLLRANLGNWRRLGRKEWEIETLFRLGNSASVAARLEVARGYFEDSLEGWREVGDLKRLAQTFRYLASVHLRLNALDEALDCLVHARRIYRQLGLSRSLATTQNDLAVVYQLLGRTEEALEEFKLLERSLTESDQNLLRARVLNNIGWVYSKALRETDQAIRYFFDALETLESLEDLRLEIDVLSNLAKVYLDRGEARRSRELAVKAHDLSVAIGDPIRRVICLNSLGEAALELGDRLGASGFFTEALERSRGLGNRRQEAEALYFLAQIDSEDGSLEPALRRVESALTITESLRADVSAPSLKATFLAFRRPYYEMAVDLRVRLYRRHRSAELAGLALVASERIKARSLLNVLAEARVDIRADVDPELLGRERTLQEQINAAELRRWKGDLQGRNVSAEEISSLLSQVEEVQSEIRAHSLRYASVARPQPAGFREIQEKLLGPDEILLEYHLGERRSYLFAVTRERIEIFDLPPRRKIESLVRTVLRQFASPTHSAWINPRTGALSFHPEAMRLSEVILGPVSELLKQRRLLLVTDGALDYVPFAALPHPESGLGAFLPLALHHEVLSIFSATIGLRGRDSPVRLSAPGQLAVFADPVFEISDARLSRRERNSQGSFDGRTERINRFRLRTDLRTDLRRLPFSGKEARMISEFMTPGSVETLTGLAATPDAVNSRDLRDHRFVHFATHGIINSRHPQLSGLILSLYDSNGRFQDGFLRLQDIYRLDLSADLVVLSACQTALGKEIRGEGMSSLTRGFLYAGAGQVLASLWRIEDKSTAFFMEDLYMYLIREGLPPISALRQAQIEMLNEKENPEWRMPFFWAPFVLQGIGSERANPLKSTEGRYPR